MKAFFAGRLDERGRVDGRYCLKHFWPWYCVLVLVASASSGSLVLAQGTAAAALRVEAGRTSPAAAARVAAGVKGGAEQRRAAARRFLRQRGLLGRNTASSDTAETNPAKTNLLNARGARAAELRARGSRALHGRALDTADALDLSAAWVPLGPVQTVTPAYGAVTGRVTSIAVDLGADASGGTVYVGTTGGGVWKSVNGAGPAGAVKFAPVTDAVPAVNAAGIGSLSIGAVSVQPGGTSGASGRAQGVVLAGTGDPNDALDSYYGEGILRSADGGVTWTAIDEADTFSTTGVSPHSFDGEGFAGFAWSTVHTNVVVAAVTRALDGVVVNARQPDSVMGLYVSEDAGASWALATIQDEPGLVVQGPQTLPTSTQGGWYDGNAATAVVWNPVRQMFYAAVRYHGYYGSPDGVTWTRLVNQPGIDMSPTLCPVNAGLAGAAGCPVFSSALAVQPVTGDMFALTVDAGGLDQGIWQDVCAASAGGACTTGATVLFGTQLGDGLLEDGTGGIAQGDYDLVLNAVASNADTLLYAGTEDIFKCSLAEGCVWRNATNVTTCAAARLASSEHAMAGVGPLLYFGNDSGLWRTVDGVGQEQPPCSADDAEHFDNLNGGLGSLAEVTEMAGAAGDAGALMVAQGVNGTSATTSATNPGEWPQVLDGFGAYVAIDPAQALNWYATAGYGVAVYLCEDGGACDAAGFPATPIVGDAQTAADGEGLEDAAVWMLDPEDSTQMIVGTCRVWRGSVAGGAANWADGNALSGMLDGDDGPVCDGNAQVRSLAASGTVSGMGAGAGTGVEILYAGMDGTLDGGETAAGHVYSASVAKGATGVGVWTDLFGSPVLNDEGNAGQFNPGGFAISSVVVDTHDTTGGTVYATVQGASGNVISEPLVYMSTSQGLSWMNISANLPTAPVNALLVDPGDANVVYVATDVGVYVTTAVTTCGTGQQQCWSALGTGMPDVPVTSLLAWGTGTAGVLRAGTYGRGVWQTGLVSAQATGGAGVTSVVLTPGSLVFGTQPVGSLSASQTITVTNTGATALAIGSIAITGDFDEQDSCDAGAGPAIAPGATCVVTVTFFPTVTGARSGLLTLVGNVPGGQVTAALSGTGGMEGQVLLDPLILNFPTTALGATATAEYITVSNLGATAVSLQTPTVTGPFAIAVNTCAGSDAPATGCTVGVVFTPVAGGAAAGVFSINTGAGTLMAQLNGSGLTPATDTLSGSSLQFAAQLVGTASAAKTVTVSNMGGSVLTSIRAVSDSGEFVVTAPGCVTGVPGGGTCAVLVRFDPVSAGTRTGTLTITDALRTQTVGMSGTGVAPAGIASVTESLVFAEGAVKGSAGYAASSLSSQMVVLTNNGKVTLTGLAFGTTGDFAAAQGTCGDALAVGASCNPMVTFVPTGTGPRTGVLTVTGGGLAQGLSTALSGMGIEFTMGEAVPATFTLVSGSSTTYAVGLMPGSTNDNPWTGTVTLACTGAPAGYSCAPDPVSATIASASTSSVTVKVGPTAVASVAERRLGVEWRGFGGLVLAGAAPWLLGWRRRRAVVAALLLLAVLAGCGTKATGGGGGGGGGTGTPTSYTLVLTASAPGVQQSISMTLDVEQ